MREGDFQPGHRAMKEAEEYQDSFERHSYLWTTHPQEFMKNFLNAWVRHQPGGTGRPP